MSDSLWPHGLQRASLSCPSLFLRVCSNSFSLGWWCHPTILSSVTHSSSCPQSFQCQGLFQWGVSSHQVTRVLELQLQLNIHSLVLPMNIQCWFPLGLTALISLLFKGLSRIFSSTTVWKHQFLGAQLSLWSNSHIIHDFWRKHSFD